MIKRKTYKFKKGNVLEVEEFHDGRYGAPGKKREKKKERTKEEIEKINQHNKTKRCRHKLLQYFDKDDLFLTLTYKETERPEDMKGAVKDFQKAMREIRRAYKKQSKELYWIRNIEQGTRGAWHVHLVVNRVDNAEQIIREAWKHGGIYVEKLNSSKYYSEDFAQLAAYLTKSEKTKEKKRDGTESKPRLKDASYSTSRNMPIEEPKPKYLFRWQTEVKPKKGYYIAAMHEGVNPVTGYLYRRYTMIRLGGEKNDRKQYLHRAKHFKP